MLQKCRNILRNEKGLTLIELLAVVVILGIIAAIAIPSIGNIISKSKDDAVIADGQMLMNAARLALISEPTLVPDENGQISYDHEDLAGYLEKFDDSKYSSAYVTVDENRNVIGASLTTTDGNGANAELDENGKKKTNN